MPFFRASGGAGGADIAPGLEILNEYLKTLGENEYLFSSNTAPQFEPIVKTLTAEGEVFSGSNVVCIFDVSKITFNKLGNCFSNGTYINVYKWNGDTKFYYGPLPTKYTYQTPEYIDLKGSQDIKLLILCNYSGSIKVLGGN